MDNNEALFFTKIVTSGSFSAASHLLNIPTSTLSRRISKLEERLGTRLLQRTTRSIQLTDIGRGFFKHCERIVEDIEEAEKFIAQMQFYPKGRLRISMPLEFGHFYMAEPLADFMLKYPEITIEAEVTTRVVNIIEEGFDLAIRVNTLEDSNLIAKKIGQVRMGLYAKNDYFSIDQIPILPNQLNPQDCIALQLKNPKWIFQKEQQEIKIIPQHRYQANSMVLIQHAVIKGVGIAVLPQKICTPYLGNPLTLLLKDYPVPSINVYAVYPSRKQITTKLRVFLDYLEKVFSQSSL